MAKFPAKYLLDRTKIRLNKMSLLHLIFGIVVFVIFLATGKFMRADFPDKEIIPPEFRMLMRSRHIYILFSSLMHILLGLYFQPQAALWRKYLQLFGSVLLIISSVLFVWAFVYETYTTRGFSEVSRLGLYLTLGGTIAHLIGNFAHKKNN